MCRTWMLLAGLMLVVVLVYVPATSYFLVYDDHEQLAPNPRLKSWTHVPAYFLTHHWAHSPLAAANYYRPLSLLWFRLEHAVFGEPGSRWHIPSLLAHLVAIGAVFLLARRLSGDDVGALAATSLFALHPFQAETVVWISSGPDILFTIFLV